MYYLVNIITIASALFVGSKRSVSVQCVNTKLGDEKKINKRELLTKYIFFIIILFKSTSA